MLLDTLSLLVVVMTAAATATIQYNLREKTIIVFFSQKKQILTPHLITSHFLRK